MSDTWDIATALMPLMNGFGLGAGLIIAIGAQNAFVLRQGIKKEHVLLVVITCIVVDAVMITLGSLGLGTLIAKDRFISSVARYGGAAFLLWYGWLAFQRFRRPRGMDTDAGTAGQGWKAALATTLALSLLNPHVYLDTVVLLGSMASRWPMPLRLWFLFGAIAASVTWFFALGYGAGRLGPLFRKPMAWRVLDLAIATVMWAIALSLLWTATE